MLCDVSCALFVVCCLLIVDCWFCLWFVVVRGWLLLFVVCCLLCDVVVCYALFVVWFWMLDVGCSVGFVIRCLLFVVHCMLFVVGYVLFVARRLLLVVCWMFLFCGLFDEWRCSLCVVRCLFVWLFMCLFCVVLLFVACCVLCVVVVVGFCVCVECSLFVIRCLQFVVSCLSFLLCCLLYVVSVCRVLLWVVGC